jgi:transposase InsO family protein
LQHEPIRQYLGCESFFPSLKTERTERKSYRTRNEVRADVLDYIERLCNAVRRHSRIWISASVEFERQVVPIKPAAAIEPAVVG